MKIQNLNWAPFRIPFRQAFTTAHGTFSHRQGVILRLETDEGIVGFGEASPLPGSHPDILNEVLALLDEARIFSPGQSLDEVHLFPHTPCDSRTLAAVQCALDVAACDAKAKAQGIPVAKVLSPHATRSVRVNATIGAIETSAAIHTAAEAREAGFDCVKLKVGVAHSIEEECERVAAVRTAIGPTMQLRLDANGAWNAEQAIRTIQALEDYDIEYIEQPVPAGNLPQLKCVREVVHIPIAADEDVTDYEAALRIIECGAAQVLVIKPMVVGDLKSARRIIDLAQASGATVVVTTSLDTGIGTAAALHLAATLPLDNPACGLATADLLVSDLLVDPLMVTRGRMAVPERMGLGIELDLKMLRQYSSKDIF